VFPLFLPFPLDVDCGDCVECADDDADNVVAFLVFPLDADCGDCVDCLLPTNDDDDDDADNGDNDDVDPTDVSNADDG